MKHNPPAADKEKTEKTDLHTSPSAQVPASDLHHFASSDYCSRIQLAEHTLWCAGPFGMSSSL